MASPVEEPRLDPAFGPDRYDPPKPESVADLLRRTREGYGQDLGTVAMQLRIRNGYLRAIEEGRFKDLPGSTYAVGFVRTYAEYLGLDAQEVLRRFREEVSEVGGQPQLIFPAAAAEGKFPGGAILLLSGVVAAVAYGAWYYMSDRQVNLLELVPEVPERLMALVSGDSAPPEDIAPEGMAREESAPEASAEDAASSGKSAPATASEGPTREPDAAEAPPTPSDSGSEAVVAASDGQGGAVETMPGEAVEPPAEQAEAPGLSAEDTAPSPEATTPADAHRGMADPLSTTGTQVATVAPESQTGAAATVESHSEPALPPAPEVTADGSGMTVAAIPPAPAVPSMEEDGQVFGADNAEARIVLQARLESWVQVTDADGATLLTRILRAGDRYRVPNEPGLVLTTGNAGGLDILVDGREIPSLGPVGVVRRDVALDPEQLVAGTALPE